ISVHHRRDDIIDRLATRERHLCIDVRLEVGELSGAVRLLLPAKAAQAAIQDLPVSRPSTGETPISKVGVPFRARMGKSSLTPRELIDLGKGDVVVFAGMSLAKDTVIGQARLLGARFDLAGALTESGFQISRAYLRGPQTELPMNGKDEATCMLPIELEIELAKVHLPVGDLANIKPGAVVPLRINAADPVLIKIGDRAIARAELVEIDGEVGARIISLFA
ncbi:MAG: FliM/FliN family flagellar motor switch protein, partial [Myxococcaceae bacterium]